MKEKILIVLRPIPSYLIYLLSFLSLRDKKIWLFSAWNANTFADNSKYFYLHVLENHKEINAIWFTKKIETKKEIEKLGGKCVLWPSIEAIYYHLKAKTFIGTHLVYDFIPELMGGSKHIELFHASFPLKKMGYDVESFYPKKPIKRLKTLLIQPFLYFKADFTIASSETTSKVISSLLNMKKNKVLNLGYPRVDALTLNTKYNIEARFHVRTIFNLDNFNKVIYFVPTFRNEDNFSFFNFDFTPDRLQETLEKNNAIMIIRLHPFDLQKEKRKVDLSKFKNIIFENHGFGDPYPLLYQSDILITDFSSIFSDFLILNRPIIFSKFGFEQYVTKERELYWDYDEVTPGAKVIDWPQLLKLLDNYLQTGNDQFEDKRKMMKEIIFSNHLNGVNENIFTHIQKMINS